MRTALIAVGVLAGLGVLGLTSAAWINGEKERSSTANAEGHALATFAGGCFWCMEPPFEKLPGVAGAISGYTGGTAGSPTYKEVCAGGTGHAEAVQVHYDPKRISYRELLEVFWRNIDPTDDRGQSADRGAQYRSAVFYHTQEQKREAEVSRARLAASGRFDQPIVTPIEPAGPFYPAEDYHQDYYKRGTR